MARVSPRFRRALLLFSFSVVAIVGAGLSTLAQGPRVGVPKSDFDGDGLDDVLGLGAFDAFGRYTGSGALFARYGAGLAGAQTWLSGTAATGPLTGYAFLPGDFDGDGKSDVLQVGLMDRVGRYSGVGALSIRSGGLTASPPFPSVSIVANSPPGWANSRFDVGDFDGDGRSDLLVISGVDIYGRYSGTGCITVRYGGIPLSQSATVACNVGPWTGYTFKVGDFDGNGQSDVIGLGGMDQYGRYTGSGGLFILSGGVSLPTQTVWSLSVPQWTGYTFQVGDFDGDAKSDLLGIGTVDIYGRYTGSGGLFVRRGGITLPTETVWAVSDTTWTNYIFHVGDFDGDSRSDVLGIGTVDPLGRYTGSGGLFIRSYGTAPLSAMTVWANSVGPWTGYVFQVGNYLSDPGAARSEVIGVGSVDAKGRYTGSGGLFVLSGGLALTQTVWSGSQPTWANYRLTRAPLNIDTADNLFALPFFSAIIDLNGDGWQEPLGAYNDAAGRWFETGAWFHGLQTLLPTVTPGRVHRDNRVADFTGDGFDDVMSNTYSCVTSTSNSFAKFHRNNGNGTFTDVSNFALSGFGGRGETILVADFDNDGDLDAYLPVYTYADAACPNENHSPLLLNNGAGQFTDIGITSGLGLQAYPGNRRPEGAQAADFDGDGWIDVYVAGHLFVNKKNLTFERRSLITGLVVPPSAPAGQDALPFDEGMKFLDWNNDGKLDIVLMAQETASPGPRLYECSSGVLAPYQCIDRSSLIATSGATFTGAFGVSAYDLNNDGREDLLSKGGTDIIVNGGTSAGSAVYLNTGLGYQRTGALMSGLGQGGAGMGLGDFNRDGKIDIAYSSGSGITRILNTLPSSGGSFTVEVLGPLGQRNQHGRVLKVTGGATGTFTRVVDSGSGYMAQNQYPVVIGTSTTGSHTVTVYFAPRSWLGETTSYPKTFSITPGNRAKVFAPSPATPTGQVQILPALPPAP